MMCGHSFLSCGRLVELSVALRIASRDKNKIVLSNSSSRTFIMPKTLRSTMRSTNDPMPKVTHRQQICKNRKWDLCHFSNRVPANIRRTRRAQRAAMHRRTHLKDNTNRCTVYATPEHIAAHFRWFDGGRDACERSQDTIELEANRIKFKWKMNAI